MTTEQIQAAILEKQQRMVLLENEANQLEATAKAKRDERFRIKGELADLNTSLVQVSTMNAAQQAMQAAQQAQRHAESQAAAQQKALAETEALNAQLRDRLAALDAPKPEQPAA